MPNKVSPMTPISEISFCAFDIETTGLSSYSRAIEIGAVRFKPGGPPDVFSTLIKTGAPIHPGAGAIHGIDASMLAFAPPPQEAIPAFLDFCRDRILVAHNARFDAAMLSRELTMLGLASPDNGIMDSLPLARRYFRGLDNHRLQTLVEHLAIPVERLHRALPDALAVRSILEGILAIDEDLARGNLEDIIGLAGGILHIKGPAEMGSKVALQTAKSIALLPALGSDSVLNISYLGGSKGNEMRPVRPIQVIKRRGVEYLDAYCLIDERRKLFRLDLINDIH